MNKLNYSFPNLTFVIPFYYDGEFRLENLFCILKILGNFNANVIVIEQGNYQHFTNTSYHFAHTGINGKYWFIPNREVTDNNGVFYRTRIINIGLKKVETKYAAIYDTDVFFVQSNYVYAYEKLDENYTFVYPYDGKFVDIERRYINDGTIKEKESFVNGSYGGAVFINLAKYYLYGLENENLIGWSPDDVERHARVSTLGGDICRIGGKCYHIEHPKIGYASAANPFNEQNLKEYHKVMNMGKEELQEYVKSWEWK